MAPKIEDKIELWNAWVNVQNRVKQLVDAAHQMGLCIENDESDLDNAHANAICSIQEVFIALEEKEA